MDLSQKGRLEMDTLGKVCQINKDFGRWKIAFQIINGKGVAPGASCGLDWSFELCPP